jgi:NAD(P)-dependent dehydrogenase (short-subunit alcohol dehydrogenase family)
LTRTKSGVKCAREALNLMTAKNRGSIINASSVAGLSEIPVASHYGAAKGGILGFTCSVALEMASRNIRVTASCPGWIDTPMTQNLRRSSRCRSRHAFP